MLSRSFILTIFFLPLLSFGLNCEDAGKKRKTTVQYTLKMFQEHFKEKIEETHSAFSDDIQNIKVESIDTLRADEFIFKGLREVIDKQFRDTVFGLSYSLQKMMVKFEQNSTFKRRNNIPYTVLDFSAEELQDIESFFIEFKKKLLALIKEHPFVFHESLRAATYLFEISAKALNLYNKALQPSQCVFVRTDTFKELTLEAERNNTPIHGTSCYNLPPDLTAESFEKAEHGIWTNSLWTNINSILDEEFSKHRLITSVDNFGAQYHDLPIFGQVMKASDLLEDTTCSAFP